jgi:hypothetical protein
MVVMKRQGKRGERRTGDEAMEGKKRLEGALGGPITGITNRGQCE